MLVYLAGPIRPKNGRTIEENVELAKSLALELWKKGYVVICPHANTDLPITLADKECEEKVWLSGDLEMIRRCDAVIVMPNWEGSKGTQGEIEFANARNIPVYYYPELPEPFRTEKTSPVQCGAFIDTIMQMYRTHLAKNADYSPANILGTGQIGVIVRLWDKMARLMNLNGFRLHVEPAEYEKPLSPKNESIEDAFMDMSVYAIIAMLLRKGAWGK